MLNFGDIVTFIDYWGEEQRGEIVSFENNGRYDIREIGNRQIHYGIPLSDIEN